MNKAWLRSIRTFTLGWFIGMVVWRIIRNAGLRTYLESLQIGASSINVLIFIAIVSILAGLIFGSIQYYNERFSKLKSSFRLQLFKALVIHLIVMLSLYLLLFLLIRIYEVRLVESFKNFILNPLALATLFYSFCINAIIIVVRHVNDLLGRGNLLKLITGRFYQPKEEYRAFMFLDLVSSTHIAEQLGHLNYSAFIQDCFHDLSAVERTLAQVYQYVGDEVVLTWKVPNSFNYEICLEAYFLFIDRLASRKDYYIQAYGIEPHFTAGLHCGPIIVTEVGSLKREIAYHGDTINVASRIRGKCRDLQCDLLISSDLKDHVNSNAFIIKSMDTITLRGKSVGTEIFSVQSKT
ncbi:MAG: adenylate/guanylate cyclase domain-containing protein [Psychroserpens sp.]|nr:adenylate/guanylate cyclase domain-containing protein [Psychroserpens sp.]